MDQFSACMSNPSHPISLQLPSPGMLNSRIPRFEPRKFDMVKSSVILFPVDRVNKTALPQLHPEATQLRTSSLPCADLEYAAFSLSAASCSTSCILSETGV